MMVFRASSQKAACAVAWISSSSQAAAWPAMNISLFPSLKKSTWSMVQPMSHKLTQCAEFGITPPAVAAARLNTPLDNLHPSSPAKNTLHDTNPSRVRKRRSCQRNWGIFSLQKIMGRSCAISDGPCFQSITACICLSCYRT